MLDLTGAAAEACSRVLFSSPLFHGLVPEQQNWLLQRRELVQFEEYESLDEQGGAPDAMLILIQGQAAVLFRKDDVMQEIGRVEAPEAVGEQAVLLGQPHPVTIAAMGQVRALRVSPDTFFPTWDPMQTATFRRRCGRPGVGPQYAALGAPSVCARLQREGFVPTVPRDGSAFTEHWWAHTWIPGANKVPI